MVSGNTARTEPSNRVHFPALDGVRALAFLMIFLTHYLALPWGFGGVNVFFVLSGFLITGILWDGRDSPGRARRFYLRRTLRIFPLYYGVLLAVLLSTPLFHWRWSAPWLAWPLYAGNLLRIWLGASSDPVRVAIASGQLHSARFPNTTLYLGHFWSLCVEEQFYLIWPWLVFSIRSRTKLMAMCASVVVLDPFLRVLVQGYLPGWVSSNLVVYSVGLPFQLDSLLLGGLLALLWRGSHRAFLQRLCEWGLVFATVAMAVYIALSSHLHFQSFRSTYRYPPWQSTWGLSFVDLYGAALIVAALRPGSPVYRVLNVRPLRALGRISYGAYVFHDIPHEFYEHLARLLVGRHLPITAAAIALTCTMALAWLSFTFFEAPILDLKERWAPSHRIDPALSTA